MNYAAADNDYTTYVALRQVLAPDLAIAPAPIIRAHMEAAFGEGAAEVYNDQLESLWGDIGKFVSKAAPVVANVGGGVLQGAMAGSSLGLPGIIAGAAVGGAGTALSQYGGGGTAGKIGAALTGVTNLAGQFSPMGRVGASLGPAISGLAGGGRGGAAGAATGLLNGILGAATGGAGGGAGQMIGSLLGAAGGGAGSGAGQALSGLLGGGARGGMGQAIGGLLQSPAAAQALAGLFGGSSAAGQLANFIQRPETQQAFAALQLGQLGRPTVPVGAARTPVPTAAFPEVLSHLADQVSAEAAGWGGDAEAALGYMQDAEGEYVGDPAFSRDRASRVWDLLNEAQAERVLGAMAAAPSAPRPRVAETEAETWTDWDADADAEAEWFDTLDVLDAESGDSEWGDSAWGDSESESADSESEFAGEAEYADA
ncbi:MAG TPA: hypothetical protein VNW53_00905 [Phenylobacterium sp.]|jgi:hypothetical protein|uniref:hypothetical protein n=1 Tax=Phenylobacterium sp. TaxID=1871053 RepID=UPI002BD24733|nr:hypothetical protein [Phenylobacterium sp.]HXA37533.1 hypothetical protein [Phenylobacterium sp.]